ncbi:MAG: endonuclease domain-containing protein [Labedaea sp.]
MTDLPTAHPTPAASRALGQASLALGQPSSAPRQPAELPAGLHGAYRRDALVADIGLPAVRAMLRVGALVRFSRQVIVDRLRMPEHTTRAAAALLWAGQETALTSHTAALLHGCTAAEAGTIHLLAPYRCRVRCRDGVRVHRGAFDQQDVCERDGLPVLALDVVIAELLCTARRSTALACADQALAGLTPSAQAELRAELTWRITTRADPRGRRRAAGLLELATGRPESPAESAVLLTVVEAGLPVPRAQFPVHDLDGRERYRLDFAWPEPMIGLEYDGHAAHEGRTELDAARDADLRKRGWLIIRASAADLRDPARLISQIRATFTVRRFVA